MRRTAQLIVEGLLDGATEPVMPTTLPDLVQDTPLDPRWALQDIALEYMEGEVGRHDWKRNWQDHKKRHGAALKTKVAEWLKHFEIDHDPQGLIDYIDGELSMKDGKWL
ncbi:MAG: hypothetical protein ACOYB3_00035 [Azonexus sp.]